MLYFWNSFIGDLCSLLLILSLQSRVVIAKEEAISWKPYKFRFFADKAGHFDAYHAEVMAPLFYEESKKGGEQKTIKLHVRKFVPRGYKVKETVWVLVGGPGQKASIFEAILKHTDELFRHQAALLLYDHRGVSKSTKLAKHGDHSFQTDVDGFASRAPVPLQAISVINAAHDLVLLAQMERKQSGTLQYAYGISYGTKLIQTAINIDPDIFTGVLMEGMMGPNWLSNARYALGQEVLKNCYDNPNCRKIIGENPYRLLNIVPEMVKNPERNECTSRFMSVLGGYMPGVSPCEQIDVMMSVFLYKNSTNPYQLQRRFSPTMLIAAMLMQLENCQNVKVIDALLFLRFENPNDEKGITSGGHALEFLEPQQGTMAGSSKSQEGSKDEQVRRPNLNVNQFVNAYISAAEAQGQERPCYCMENWCSARLFKECLWYQSELYKISKFKKYLYKPDPRTSKPFKTKKTRVIVVQGLLDYNTPHDTAKDFFDEFSAPVKRFYSFRNGGHNVINGDPCFKTLIRELLGEGSAEATESCVKAMNSQTLDWEGKYSQDANLVKRLLPTTSTPAKERLKNCTPGEECNPSWLFYILLGVGGVIVLIMLILLGFVLVRKLREGR